MLRRQPTLLLFLASAVAFGALAAWALAPVQEHSSSSSLSSRWKSVKVSLVGRDPLDPLDKEKRRKQESCPRGVEVGADVECPPHKSETHYKKYSVREYYGGDWATIKIQSARLELAAAKGYAALGRYFNGNNDENEKMPSTVPFLVGFTRPENSTDNTGSDFVVGAWIPDSYQDGRAPMPRKDDRIEVARFSRETYFLSNWTGAPATAGTVATKAEELSKALDDNKEHYHTKMAWLMSYSPMTQLTNRYYEVAFEKKSKKEGEGEFL